MEWHVIERYDNERYEIALFTPLSIETLLIVLKRHQTTYDAIKTLNMN